MGKALLAGIVVEVVFAAAVGDALVHHAYVAAVVVAVLAVLTVVVVMERG